MYGYGSHGDPGLDPVGYGWGVVVRLLGKLGLLALIWIVAFHQLVAAEATVRALMAPLTTFTQNLNNLGG